MLLEADVDTLRFREATRMQSHKWGFEPTSSGSRVAAQTTPPQSQL